MPEPPRSLLFGVPVVATTTPEFLDAVLRRIAQKQRTLIGYLNAHTSNLLHKDAALTRFYRQQAHFVYADGMAVVRASRRIGSPPLPERINAGDFLPRLLWMAHARQLKVALLGSRPEVVAACAENLQRRVPGLRFSLIHHGHFAENSPEEAALLHRLRADPPDLLLIGMGSPRQELWAIRAARSDAATVLWCVGALFEYYADARGRAPLWMRRAGLEWLARLALEPRRMARRYLIGNIEFLLRVARTSRP